MSGGGSSTTSKVEIPSEAKPYLYGNTSTSGVLPEAGRIYDQQKAIGPYQDQSMAMMNPVQDYGYMRQSQVGDQMAGLSQNAMNSLGSMGMSMLGGGASGGGSFSGGGGGGGGGSYTGNYKKNIDQILGMDYKNPHLEDMINNTQDSASQAFERNVMPQLRGNAIGAGQYGSSRDYIAQGLASGDLARHMTDTAANQYGGAYNQAYNAMTGLTGQLSGQASAEDIASANRDASLAASAQSSQRQYDLGMRQLGLSALNSIGGLGNMGLQGAQSIQGAGAPYQSQEQGLYDLGRSNETNARQFEQGLLNNYSGTIIPGAGMGQSQTQQQNPGALSTLGMLGNLGLGFLAL